MPAQQFVVQLANQPGTLATLLELMAARGLDVRSVCASAVNTHGAAVLIFNDADFAREILRAEKYVFIESEALVTSAPDEPGALAQMTRRLADARRESARPRRSGVAPGQGRTGLLG